MGDPNRGWKRVGIAGVMMAAAVAVTAGFVLTGAAPSGADSGSGTSAVAGRTAAPKTPKPSKTPKRTPTPRPTATPAQTAAPVVTASPEPPEATPAPVPAGEADMKISGVQLTAPSTSKKGSWVIVTATAFVQNGGPAESVIADTTFRLTVPSGCKVSKDATFTVQDAKLPLGVEVGIVRAWTVSCSRLGAKTFMASASVVPDAGQATDPAGWNNAASGAVSTLVK